MKCKKRCVSDPFQIIKKKVRCGDRYGMNPTGDKFVKYTDTFC